jgi:LytS/YehU family sensor histidine kinase
MLLSLSNMLSYSLYESDNDLITLHQEITAVEDFIFFQNQHDQQITLTVEDRLDVDSLLVPPMIIFSSLQNNFLKIKNSNTLDCRTHISIRSSTYELIVNFRFKGDCVEKNLVAPVNIRVPLKYADRKIDMTYDPA